MGYGDAKQLRMNLEGLVVEWRRRARAAERGHMPQIAMDYNDCADELKGVMQGRSKALPRRGSNK